MKSIVTFLAASCLLTLGACGSGKSDSLQEAAEQSTPEAAQVLNERAAAIDGEDGNGSLSAPGSPAQQAMEEAGNAQAANGQGAD